VALAGTRANGSPVPLPVQVPIWSFPELPPPEELALARSWPKVSRGYLAAALVLAVASALLVHGYSARASRAIQEAGPRVSVLVAAAPIARGTVVSREDLRASPFPRVFAPPRYLSSISRAAGRVALADIVPGQPVTDTLLARVRAGPVASLVPEGLRAFAVPTSLPAGSVASGDHVDVLATFSTGQPHTETVVEGVEVLLVLGSSASTRQSGGAGGLGGAGLDAAAAGAGGGMTLVVLVSPDQERSLAYARAFADLEVAIAPAPG
jgi:pilus assembly protein CpaB